MKEKERQNFTTYTYKRRKKIKAVLKAVGVAVVLGGAVATATLIGTKFTTKEQTATVQLNQNSKTGEKSSSEEMELEANSIWKPSSKFTSNTTQINTSTAQNESENVSTTQNDNKVVETKDSNNESATSTNNATYIVGHYKREFANTHKVEVGTEHLNGNTTVAGLYNLNMTTKENGKETKSIDLNFGAGYTHGISGINSGTAVIGAELQKKVDSGVVYSVNGDYAMTIHQDGIENTLTVGAGANMGNLKLGVEGYIQGGSTTKTSVGGKVVGSYKWGAGKSEATLDKEGKSVESIINKSRNDNSLLSTKQEKNTNNEDKKDDEDKKDTLTPDKEEVTDPEKENVDTEKTTETNKTNLNPEYEDTLDPEL